MEREFWQRQGSEPLFADIEWSRPASKAMAGNLLIMGGNLHAFAAPAKAYGLALQDGIGQCRVVMPQAVKKLISGMLPDCEFTASTPSGSFSKKGLQDLMAYANWSNATLLTGDLGRNSETAILLEEFVSRSSAALVLTRDAADYFMRLPLPVLDRAATTLVVSLAQLQKMAMFSGYPKALTYDFDFFQMIDWLHDFSDLHRAHFIIKHNMNIFAAVQGKVSSTKLEKDIEIWRLTAAVHASVNWLQNARKPFEAFTHAVYQTAYPDKAKQLAK